MSKKERELRQLFEEKRTSAIQLAEEGKVEEARTLKAEMKSIEEQIMVLKELRTAEKKNEEDLPKMPENRDNETNIELRDVFFKSLRGEKLNEEEKRALSGLAGADGGLLIPQDIQTKINEYKRQYLSVLPYIRVEPVNTRTGSRVFEKLATMTPFADLAEMGTIADAGNPQFQNISYSIKDYAGLIKLSNTFLADTPENVMDYLGRWVGKKTVLTENNKVFSLLDTTYSTKVQITASGEVKAIKKILNVTLDPAISANAKVYTNQDGFQLLDSLLDGQNRPLLQPDPTSPTTKRLFGKEVVVFPNSQLVTTGTTTKKAPFIVGDLTEVISFFDRGEYEMRASDVAGTAFETNTTSVRVIERFDVQVYDKDAAVYAQLDVTNI